MDDIFLRLKEQLGKKYPFAIYVKPGSNILTAVFQKNEDTYTADYTEKGFVFAPFNSGSPVFIPYTKADILKTDIAQRGVALPQPQATFVNESQKESFEVLVKKSISAITEGRFEKLVTSRTETTPMQETDDVTVVFSRLIYSYPNAFRYCFYSPQSGLWMGATPEQLLKIEDNILYTVALAGTQVYNEGKEAVWEQKEVKEQEYVTDYILQSIHKYAESVNASEPYTFRAGNIIHIKTDISAELKEGYKIEEVIKALHPTPAVCGLPKESAKEFLLEHEGYNREYYSGYLGEINHDFTNGAQATDLFVNLRCMKITGNEAQLFIGCGITKDSDPEKEFYETVNKSLTMKRVL